jgi:hypothetical protein
MRYALCATASKESATEPGKPPSRSAITVEVAEDWRNSPEDL